MAESKSTRNSMHDVKMHDLQRCVQYIPSVMQMWAGIRQEEICEDQQISAAFDYEELSFNAEISASTLITGNWTTDLLLRINRVSQPRKTNGSNDVHRTLASNGIGNRWDGFLLSLHSTYLNLQSQLSSFHTAAACKEIAAALFNWYCNNITWRR